MEETSVRKSHRDRRAFDVDLIGRITLTIKLYKRTMEQVKGIDRWCLIHKI